VTSRPGLPAPPPAAAPLLALAGGLALAPVLAGPAFAADERLALTAYARVTPASLDYTASLAPVEFAEAGWLEARHEAATGLGFELEAELRLTRRLGLVGSWGQLQRDVAGGFDAALPHPLYFERPRAASGSFDGGRYRENAAHLSVAWRGGGGAWSYRVFAGASFFQVKADMVASVAYTHEYPYDAVEVTGVRLVGCEDSAVGAHAGASLVYALASRVGLTLRFRYSRATATLAVEDAGSVELDAGGPELALGLQVRLFD